MSDIKLGELLTGDEKRDAVHIAVLLATAGEALRPGEHVGLKYNEAYGGVDGLIGVVDPFLTESAIYRGTRFWIFLYPNTVQNLRHNWDLPGVPTEEAEEEEEMSDWEKGCCI